ncbi:DUF4396 domain-containing protein [Acuticoccus sp. MNP-M23]|uniref:DUF4396 domain-containing protein n=1 Tax=Acuticoccus sp. MNP-M23 TaxID=3072793 RepID=UPI0035C198AA
MDHEHRLAGCGAVRQHSRARLLLPLRQARGEKPDGARRRRGNPLRHQSRDRASHCGSGCTLGDIVAEWLAFFVPAVAVWFGWQSVFADKIFAVWGLDFVIAFVFGIAFQYFAIKPMSDLSVGAVLVKALKADALSLLSWQVGMYAFMALAHFVLFEGVLGVSLAVNSAEFWFMMQIAMLCGFVTAYPVNWWLIRAGIKEAM